MITTGIGPSPGSFSRRPANDNHSSSGRMTALAVAADGQRMYAGSWAGVWRSIDGGRSWSQITWPQPPSSSPGEIPGALYAPHIFDLAASPADPNVVLACGLDSQYKDGRDGIYRSADGGSSWTLVLKTIDTCNIVFAPDDPQLVYAVTTGVTGGVFPRSMGIFAVSRDAGASWTTQNFAPNTTLWHIAVAPAEPAGRRRLYALGDSVVWYSEDGGAHWKRDAGVATQILNVRAVLSAFQASCDPNAGIGGFGGRIAFAGGDAAQILAVDPTNPAKVYMATTGGALGPTYYSDKVPNGTLVNTRCERLAGEASLWLGDFTNFQLNNGRASWELLPGPPVYTGATTPSGNCYVVTKPTSSGFLVVFSDNSHVHVSAGKPTANASWHRLDGKNASVEHGSNKLFVHADPHATAFTPDFDITLKPSTHASPFDKNSELEAHIAGRLFMANDGGVYWCDDGGRQESSWQMPPGIETLDAINIAGICGHGTQPALYIGCGDNNDFFTRDGGQHWGDPGSGCGDCDAWFADPAQGDRVIQFLPRRGDGVIGIVRSDGSSYPDASDGDSKTYAASPKKIHFSNSAKLTPYAQSDVYLLGYRPLILTLATEAPPSDTDLIIVEQALDRTAFLFRTTKLSAIEKIDDWHDASKAQQIGPQLPSGAIIPQASGGHARPVFYVGTRFGGSVFKLNAAHTSWDQIVPNASLATPVLPALRWFVDPYEPNTIYVLDADGIKVSSDGGRRWDFDEHFTRALTAGNNLSITASLLQDMLFLRGERQTRFAVGTAGVFWTDTFGVEWLPVLNSIALPGRPESVFFDPLSDPSDRSLYVECEGRSILRVSSIPGPPPFQAHAPIDLMTVAALEY